MIEKNLKYSIFNILYLLVSFLFIACYSIGIERGAQADSAAQNQKLPWRLLNEPRLITMPQSVAPGEYVTIIYAPVMGKANENSVRTSVLFDENGKKIASAKLFLFNMDDDGHSVFVSLIAPPSTAKPGKALVKIEAGNSVLMQTPLEIVKKDFISEIIPLNPSNTTLRTKPDPKKTEEAEKLWSILKTSGNDIWGSAAFVPPVAAETRRSSFFGDRRVYKYSDGKSDTSVHAGIDYAVPKNTPVKACAAGKVILARPRIVTGNSIIIEHIPAVYSIYYHLEKIQVEENSIVKAGDVIGLSGSTGLSTGPHLHWEIRVSTENADPDTFCARAPLDRAAIFKAIFD